MSAIVNDDSMMIGSKEWSPESLEHECVKLHCPIKKMTETYIFTIKALCWEQCDQTRQNLTTLAKI